MYQQRVTWRNVIIFCILAYALLWIPLFGATLTGRGGNDPGVWGIALGIMGPFSPLIAALLMRLLITREGFRDAHLGLRKVRWHFWLLAILLPFFWNGAQDFMQLSFGFGVMDWSKFASGLYRIPINLFGGLIIFIGEEFGWRSYLLEKLRPLGRAKALLLSGVIWSLWHAPLVIFPSNIYTQKVDLAGASLALLVFVLAGFIFGWMYLESDSVWPCVLMHSYNNLITFKLFSEAWSIAKEPTLFQNSLMALAPIFIVWLVLYWKGAFKSRQEVMSTTESQK